MSGNAISMAMAHWRYLVIRSLFRKGSPLTPLAVSCRGKEVYTLYLLCFFALHLLLNLVRVPLFPPSVVVLYPGPVCKPTPCVDAAILVNHRQSNYLICVVGVNWNESSVCYMQVLTSEEAFLSV